jgi:hypothetical protein
MIRSAPRHEEKAVPELCVVSAHAARRAGVFRRALRHEIGGASRTRGG